MLCTVNWIGCVICNNCLIFTITELIISKLCMFALDRQCENFCEAMFVCFFHCQRGNHHRKREMFTPLSQRQIFRYKSIDIDYFSVSERESSFQGIDACPSEQQKKISCNLSLLLVVEGKDFARINIASLLRSRLVAEF